MTSDQVTSRLRLLVAITCFGVKNSELLQHLIRQYQSMDFDVDIVVLSNIPRDLGPSVTVVVGLPSEDPWSLPFAHQRVFAENVDNYDLFAYSEDDIGVTERNIRAFVRVSSKLAANEIAGFLRYEVDSEGTWSLPDVHGGYHWKPESAGKREDVTVAEFTNEHAAFYLLTRSQLAAMVAADGFVRDPYLGRYDMACTAATDPYTRYGFHKVVCVSSLDDFLIHHLSNRYTGEMGVSLAFVREQVQSLVRIAEGTQAATTLFNIETRWRDGQWARNYYEKPDSEVIDLVPNETSTMLSVGCGWGATELTLIERGIALTAVPLNSTIFPVTAHSGLNIVHGSFAQCLEKLQGTKFDCVYIPAFLHLVENPIEVIEHCTQFLSEGGSTILCGLNFGSVRILGRRIVNKWDYRKLGSYEDSGLHLVSPCSLKSVLRHNRLRISRIVWSGGSPSVHHAKVFGRWLGERWILRAEREPNCNG